jgi:hypothetical protein
MRPCHLNIFDYGTIPKNIINYSILGISFLLAYNTREDLRIYIVLCVSTFVQILLCSCLVSCHGISIIYCFIFGFLIKSYRDKKDYKTSNNLILMTTLLIFVSGITFNIQFTKLLVFLLYHMLFIGVGASFTLIPPKIMK